MTKLGTATSSARRPRAWAAVLSLALLLTMLSTAGADAGTSRPSRSALLPIVFVHGNSGSVAQFESQFQRFASNGYPQRLMFAYEYDTSGPDNTAAIANLGPFIDGVLARTGARQVYLAAHSRGTTVSHAFLADPAQAAKVAKYVNLDGRSAATPPGGVPTLAVWGEWQSPPDPVRGAVGSIGQAVNVYNRDFGHVETASSPRTFGAMYRFLLGRAPATTDVLPDRADRVQIAGRAVLFPQNAGFAGSTLRLWRVAARSGQRVRSHPEATMAIDGTGRFGPLRVDPAATYELALTRPDGVEHHFYQQPFTRSDFFLRLNSSPTGTGLEAFTPRSPRQVDIGIIRAREMWGDQGAGSDVLTVDSLGDGQPPLSLLTPATAPRSSIAGDPLGNTGENNAVFVVDVGAPVPGGYAAPDQQTDLGKGQLFPFNTLTFLGAVDVFVPADPRARGIVQLALEPRGGAERDVVNIPNWPSTDHRISVTFRDAFGVDA
jgi:pimeloyl-ACP methyl ester carboxylesterase